MLRVGIIGVSGYTGVELARILSGHPQIEITVATSRQYEGKPLSEVYPNLRGCVELTCTNPAADELPELADFFFT
ncbi:MAG: N-acetyl-gamma-glutamyl-phosphate reductase, partial [Thermodesulfobacteriota bacterium]